MTDSKVTVGNNVGGGGSGQGLGTPPSLVEFEGLRFLITEAPKNKNLHVFLKNFKKFNVTNIVRISEPLYSADAIEKAGIKVIFSPICVMILTSLRLIVSSLPIVILFSELLPM